MSNIHVYVSINAGHFTANMVLKQLTLHRVSHNRSPEPVYLSVRRSGK